ncbi:chromosome partitioning protein ParA [Nocardioides sp. OK12]|uniref:phage portal protein n=1 Tax=Nocardioides sp. OK12 TaxID=2758661 RepID=UPI0021C29BC8|nr:phage portal protein [Nocardioides sp. OK12]GHJ59141.1 chromosome partitioning protein ParA [Nocardioides sp. OK12]
MLSKSAALEVVAEQMFPIYREQREQLDMVDSWINLTHEGPKIPRNASEEHKWIATLAKTPLLSTVVTTVAQALYATGYKSTVDADDPWRTWQANDLDHRQVAIHRAAIGYGFSFTTVMPGQDSQGPRSVIRGVSPRKMVALYADPAEDDWPMYAARFDAAGQSSFMVRLYDDEVVHFVSVGASGDEPTYIEYREHGAGVTPVVRYSNSIDLEGRTFGEVTPLIPVAKRINKTDYDRMLAQHSNSWNLRVFSGIDASQGPNTEGLTPAQAAEKAQIRLRQSDVVTLKDPNSKAWSLPATPLEGFISSRDSDIDALASTAQIPVTAFSKLSNISADTLVEIRAGLNQKVFERQMSFGKSHAQTLRMAAQLEGNLAAAEDYEARMDWRDTRVRPWGQTVDALGKAAQMLGVPVEELWEELPWLDQSDLSDLKNAASVAAATTARTQIAEAAAAARQDPTVARLVNRADRG